MATYSVNQMKKVIKKLEKINITTEKEILNLKVLEVKKLKEQDKVSMNDIEIIWEIQGVRLPWCRWRTRSSLRHLFIQQVSVSWPLTPQKPVYL